MVGRPSHWFQGVISCKPQLLALVAFAAVGIVAVGCSSVAGFSSPSLLRVIDASTVAPAVDVYAGSQMIATNLGANSATNYAQLAPSKVTIYVRPTGKKTVMEQIQQTLVASKQSTLLLADSSSGPVATMLADQQTPAPTGQVSLRFIQEAALAGAVDIYLIPDGSALLDAKPVMTAVAPGRVTDYIAIPASTLDLVVVPTGAPKTFYTSKPIAFVSGQVRSYLIVDQRLTNKPSVDVVTANDVD